MAYCAWCGNQVPQASYAACPRCGNPANGAQRVGSAGGKNPALLIIGIVAGGLVLLAIIGILAAIAIPNFLTAMQRAKQKRSMADMRSIATAVEEYAGDKDEYPRATTLAELTTALSPKYMKTVPVVDGWGTAFKYECWPADSPCRSYAIGSAGADQLWEHESLQAYSTETKTIVFDADLVFTNGTFAQYPEGIQRAE